MNAPRPHVVMTTKSPGLAILLTILFGPLGMLYSTILGAIIMFVLSVVLGFVTFGLAILVTWPICVIWAGLAASSYNRKIVARAAG